MLGIVKLSFHPENVPLFPGNFELTKEKIRNATRNRLLELYRDKENPSLFLPTAIGKAPAILKHIAGRNLSTTVEFTKMRFNDRPAGWSVEKLVTLA